MTYEKNKRIPQPYVRGRPTGANEFFFPKKEIVEKYKIEKRYLKPGLMKPKGNNYFEIKNEHIERFFFATGKEEKEKLGSGARAYINYGERLKIHKGKTFAKKRNWYQFVARKPADIIIPCGIGERIYGIFNTAEAVTSNSYTEIRLKNKKNQKAIWAFFNSAVGWLFMELYGRHGMGGGMLKVDPTDIRKMFVIEPEYINFNLADIKPLLKRKAGTIKEECNAEDRKVLDELIMGKVLKLTKEEQKKVYDAVNHLVKSRLEKANSTTGKKKLRNGIDTKKLIEDLKKDIIETGD